MKTLSVLLFAVLGVIVAHAQTQVVKVIPIKSGGNELVMREYSTSMGTFSFIASPLTGDGGRVEEMQYSQKTFSTTDGGTATLLKYETNNVKQEQPIKKDIEISIYPNPLSTIATLRITNESESTNYELRIYDLLGRDVRQLSIINQQSTIERGSMQAGIYIYEVRNEGQIAGRGKLIIVNE